MKNKQFLNQFHLLVVPAMASPEGAFSLTQIEEEVTCQS